MNSFWRYGACVMLSVCAVVAASQQHASSNPMVQSARMLESQGKFAEAEKAWRAVAAKQPNNPEPWAHLGLLEARQAHFKEAVPHYRKALALGPPMENVRLNLALALFKSGQVQDSIPELESLYKAHPERQQVTILLGMAHYGLAQYKEAAPYLKNAADHDPKNLPLRLALAHSYLWSKQLDKVMDVYREILAIDPDSAEADMIAGEALDEMKDNEGSTKMFRAAVKANPKTPNAHFGLAYLLWSQKKYDEAKTEFLAELRNDPDHLQSLLYLADTHIQLNHPELARPLLERVVVMDPATALGHLDLGIICAESGQNEEAIRELKAAEKLMPEDGEITTDMVTVHWRLGRLYRTMGRRDEAKAEFDKASLLNQKADADLHSKIANGHARQLKPEEVLRGQGQPVVPAQTQPETVQTPEAGKP